ncbi:TPA: hypothetical protein MJA52_001919 [Klebsiella aerogenes]|nr:hypothetical protein [Klebsiella aerogenes]
MKTNRKLCNAKHRQTFFLSTLALCIFLAETNQADAFVTDACTNPSPIVKQNPYRTTTWNDNGIQSGPSGKFLYGGYTTLISSHIMGQKHRQLIGVLNNASASDQELSRLITNFENDYCNQSELMTLNILNFAINDLTQSIFQEERSAITNDTQNKAFIDAMPGNASLKPVDNMIRNGKFQSDNFQYNTHRGLYNAAYGIPQNSLASIVNAYVAGIRSVEFDVLETTDNQNIVIHDLTTNNTTGAFNTPPEYVSMHRYEDIHKRPMDILNPLGAMQAVETSNARNMLLSERFLYVMHKFLPGMTAYIDARNNAPVSAIHILKNNPEYKDSMVVKVYPFTLKGGVNSLVDVYKRYTQGNVTNAAQEIARIQPNVLLALGSAATQANEAASSGSYSTFDWSAFRSSSVLPKLPFSRANTSYNQKLTKPFTTHQLMTIESMTYNMSKWAFDFSAVTNVMVYQVNINPSLRYLIDRNNTAEIDRMPDGDRMLSATLDNFVTLFSQIKNNNLPAITLNLPNGGSKSLQSALEAIRWGFSDRYPDYTFARKKGDGSVDQGTIRDFLYSMEGTVYERNEYSPMKMRSTQAAMDKMVEMKSQGLIPGYATTDLPTDLRQGAMGLLGKNGLPSDIRFRSSALIKPHLLPDNIPSYVRPEWTNRLYGDAAQRVGIAKFDSDVEGILKYKNDEIPRYQGAVDAIITAKISLNQTRVPITNQTVLSTIGATEPVLYADKHAELDHAENILQTDLTQAQEGLNVSLADFKRVYGIEFIWEPSQPYFPAPPQP